MGVGTHLVEWGYNRFFETPILFNSRYGPVVASYARDAVFYAFLVRRGDVGETVVGTDVLDHELYVDLRDRGVSRTLYINGEYEPKLTRACPRLVERGETVVDVGANIGYFTVLFSQLVGEHGSVLALEPDPRNFELLERNLATNDCDNAVAEQVALADRIGTLGLVTNGDQFSRTHVHHDGQRGEDAIEIGAVTVDERVDGPVDLLKVDTAGSELVVIQGALRTLEEHRPKLVVPYLPNKWSDDRRGVFDRLRSMGYDPRTIGGRSLSYAGALESDERIPNVLFEP